MVLLKRYRHQGRAEACTSDTEVGQDITIKAHAENCPIQTPGEQVKLRDNKEANNQLVADKVQIKFKIKK